MRNNAIEFYRLFFIDIPAMADVDDVDVNTLTYISEVPAAFSHLRGHRFSAQDRPKIP